jgi:hypothetical protein
MSANCATGVISTFSTGADVDGGTAPGADAVPQGQPVSRERHDVAVATAIGLASVVAIVVGTLTALLLMVSAPVGPEAQAGDARGAVVARAAE